MKTKKPYHDSGTNVNMVWKGPKKVVGFRCNENLWKRFKQLTEQEGSSVCAYLEAIISAVLAATTTPVNKRSTIEIKELHVDRVVSRPRRFARDVGGENVRVETSGSREKCGYGCEGSVVAVHFVWADPGKCVETYVCGKHHDKMKGSSAGYRLL